jgi:hypothetical protein
MCWEIWPCSWLPLAFSVPASVGPDVSVAIFMGSLALQGAFVVIRHALTELKEQNL